MTFTDTTPFEPPLRVVLDPGLATVSRGKVREGDAPTLYVHAPDTKLSRGIDAQLAVANVERGRFDLHAVLKLLTDREINEVHVETGATLAGAFLEAGLVDELVLYVAPVILGSQARPLFDGLTIESMAERLELELVELRHFDRDIRLVLQPRAATP